MIERYFFPIEGQSFESFVIFDRDDTLIRDVPGLRKVSDVNWLPLRMDLLKKLAERNVLLAIATNQSAIGRGILTTEEFVNVSESIHAQLRKQGINLWAIIACPHVSEEDCKCRKPEPGMLNRLVEVSNREWEKISFVGNADSDIEAARRANTEIRGIKLEPNLPLDIIQIFNEIEGLV